VERLEASLGRKVGRAMRKMVGGRRNRVVMIPEGEEGQNERKRRLGVFRKGER